MRSTQPLRRIRVFVADSNAIHSELLAEALGRAQQFDVVGYAANSLDVVQLVCTYSPDVLLVSASSREKSTGGLGVLASVRGSFPNLKTVVLLESAKREIVVQAFRLGARGVFSKEFPVTTLGKCITCVCEGQVWATTEELGFVLEALADAPIIRPLASAALSQLSARELDVVNCLAEGLSNREIAERLNLSRHTVKNYMFRIFDKVGVSSRVELLFHVLSRPAAANQPILLRQEKRLVEEPTLPSIVHEPPRRHHRAMTAGPIDGRSNGRDLTSREPDASRNRQAGLLPRMASA
jgi:two-component system, NarL family, nitrate/nitrite response regulator NarL